LRSLLLLLFTAISTLAQPVQNPYAGSAACRGCHTEISSAFFRNPHNQGNVRMSDAAGKPAVSDCETCHGPGRAHIAAKTPEEKKRAIRAFSLMNARQVNDNCLSCHSNSLSHANIRRSAHTQADVSCASCHSIHKVHTGPRTPPKLLAKQQTELCYTCHANVRAQFSLPVKHRVNEGFQECSDCHNPHGAEAPTTRMGARPRMMNHGLGNEEACLKCHVEYRGPFVFEHGGVRIDGCGSCHAPHGSMNSRLIKRPAVFTLCLECHNGVGNFGRQGDGVALQSSSHSMTDPRYQQCTGCHVKIHGSHTDPLFLR
jgi:DmsE family decaheme c-type cytochrome